MLSQVEFQVHCSGRAAKEIHRVGKEPEDPSSKIKDECYAELLVLAKEVGK